MHCVWVGLSRFLDLFPENSVYINARQGQMFIVIPIQLYSLRVNQKTVTWTGIMGRVGEMRNVCNILVSSADCIRENG
jgi:hypothetical protein